MTRTSKPDAALLRQTAPIGAGWVYATFWRCSYGRNWLGFRKYDLPVSIEGGVLILHTGWRFVGFRGQVPLVEVLAAGWMPHRAELER